MIPGIPDPSFLRPLDGAVGSWALPILQGEPGRTARDTGGLSAIEPELVFWADVVAISTPDYLKIR